MDIFSKTHNSADFSLQTDPLLRSHPATPPSQSSSAAWVRSPARVDPEHLKAVWSQTPDKDGLPTVNSLKGIADDLSTVPFSIHEVKSEDGGTPPLPGPVAPPSRMSASEVTRAFQTVPSGPSNPSLRVNPFSPPIMGSPLNGHKALKPPVGLPQPPMDPNASRSPYMSYPPQLNGHSPSPPTLIYSHVSPATTSYAQPMWMSLPQQGPQMMRPQPSSPYSPSLMPYSIPASQNGMYHPPNPASQPQPPQYSRPMGSQLLVSPVMPQASPVPHHMVYATSPMLMHPPPPGPVPQPQPYAGAIGMGRGSIPPPPTGRNPMDQRHPPNPMSQPPAAPTPRFPTHNPGYSHVPPQSFIRPSW